MNSEEIKQIPREEREAFLKKADDAFQRLKDAEMLRELAEAAHEKTLRRFQGASTAAVECRRIWQIDFRDQLTLDEVSEIVHRQRQ